MKILYTPLMIVPALDDTDRKNILDAAGAGSTLIEAKDPAVQRKETTKYGDFDTTKYDNLGAPGSEVGVDIELTFEPGANVDATKIGLTKPIISMKTTTNGDGYWLLASDGGIFSYGNAAFYGSTGAIHLNKPVVGLAPVSDGSGYRLIASDGGVFSYDAPFFGSTGAIRLNKPVVTGFNNNSYDGYWMVASDGGVFTFSPPGENMPFYRSAA